MDAHDQLAILHTVILTPFLIYVGMAKTDVPDELLYAVGGLGAVIFLYHGFKAYTKIMAGKAGGAWVNYIHMFVLAPLLIVIGVYRKETSRKFFEMLLMTGLGGFGYHLLQVLKLIGGPKALMLILL